MTLSGLIGWLKSEYPSAALNVESEYLFKPGLREDLEIRVYVWIDGRTIRIKGPSVAVVHQRLLAELAAPRIAADVLALDWEGVRS